MVHIGWFIGAVAIAVLVTAWVTFTATRLDRLHARCDAAWAALDAQLVRRAAAVQHAAENRAAGAAGREEALSVTAQALHESDESGRASSENAVGRVLTQLCADPGLAPADRAELTDTANRVMIARRFYNDAVRDTRSLRERRMPRLLHLAGHRAHPRFFDIDDTVPPARGSARPAPPATPAGSSGSAGPS